MFLHILIDPDGQEILSVNAVKQKDVLTVLNETPDCQISYVLNIFDNTGLLDEYKEIDWNEMYEVLSIAEGEGYLIAKYDNGILE